MIFKEYEKEVRLQRKDLPDSVNISLRRLKEEPGSQAAISPSSDYVYIEGKLRKSFSMFCPINLKVLLCNFQKD